MAPAPKPAHSGDSVVARPGRHRITDVPPRGAWESALTVSMLVALIALAVVAIAVVLLLSAIRIGRQYERIVVSRLGHLRGERGPASLRSAAPFITR